MSVEVAQRYYLRVPNMPYSHPLRGLGDRVRQFTDYCTFHGVEGRDPVGAIGTYAATVKVLATGLTVGDEPSPLHMADPSNRRNPPAMKRPVPGALVHLARWKTVKATVEIPIEMVIQLGIDPDQRWFVTDTPHLEGEAPWSMVEALSHWDDDDGDPDEDLGPYVEPPRPEVIEERDFTIPCKWLFDIDSVPLWPHMRRMLEDEAAAHLRQS